MHISTLLTQVVLALAVFTSHWSVHAARVHRRADVCNGHAEFCNRGYGNVTFVGAHNSYAVGTNDLFANQDYDILQQLKDGVRMLQMQAHNNNGTIQLCHTACSLNNGGTLKDYLGKVKGWMDTNPNDVVTLLIVNSDNLPPSEYDAVFKVAGVDTMSYTPSSASIPQSDWPTLGSLIDSGKRLVIFLSTTADFNAVPYLIDEFTNMWETAFDVLDPNFDCEVDRSKGDPATTMFTINHFLDKTVLGFAAPNKEAANVTNGVSGLSSLGQHVSTCVTQHGRNPNFMLVDFYEYGGGSVFQVAADANGVTYNPTTPVATPIPDNNSSQTTSNQQGQNSAASQLTFEHYYASATVLMGLLLGSSFIL